MISESVVHATSGFVYAVTVAVLLAWLRGVPERLRRYSYLLVFVVGLGAVTSFLTAAGVGTIALDDGTLSLPTFANDAVAYSVLWFVTAMLADVSRRTLAFVSGLPFLQVVAFQFGATAGGLVGLFSTVFVIGGHLVLAYLFVGPIWRGAQDLPDQRRVLHWKSRNLLLFLIGMLIVFAFLSLAGAFTSFGSLIVGEYVAVLIRVGFAGFIFVNIDALDAGGMGYDGPDGLGALPGRS